LKFRGIFFENKFGNLKTFTYICIIIKQQKNMENNMKKVFDLLAVLKMSCNEGLNGTWDCTTEEGRESFDDMITIIEWIEKELKQK
jgi:hypothetical protein